MKKIMIISATLVFAAIFATVLTAQPGPGQRGGGMMAQSTPEQKAQRMTEMLKQRLSLTDEQAAQIQKISLDSFTKEKALMDQMKQEENNRQAAINKVLTPEQQQQMQQDRDKMKERMQNAPQQHGKQGAGKQGGKAKTE